MAWIIKGYWQGEKDGWIKGKKHGEEMGMVNEWYWKRKVDEAYEKGYEAGREEKVSNKIKKRMDKIVIKVKIG